MRRTPVAQQVWSYRHCEFGKFRPELELGLILSKSEAKYMVRGLPAARNSVNLPSKHRDPFPTGFGLPKKDRIVLVTDLRAIGLNGRVESHCPTFLKSVSVSGRRVQAITAEAEQLGRPRICVKVEQGSSRCERREPRALFKEHITEQHYMLECSRLARAGGTGLLETFTSVPRMREQVFSQRPSPQHTIENLTGILGSAAIEVLSGEHGINTHVKDLRRRAVKVSSAKLTLPTHDRDVPFVACPSRRTDAASTNKPSFGLT